MLLLLLFFLLLLLLLWWFLVKYFRSKTSKNSVFCVIFVLVKEKTLVFTTVLQRQGQKSSKNIAKHSVFRERVENTVFCDVFSTRGFKCTANTTVFFMFYTSSSQSKPTKNSGIYTVLTRQHARKNDVLEQFFAFFSSCLSSKTSIIFCCVFATFVCRNPCRKVVTPKTTADCLGPQNAVNYGVL